jgi:membrane protease YdiL (CAAX protease family)
MYGHQPYPPPYAHPATYPPAPYPYYQPRSPADGPGPEWKKVGERLVQKRDYLVWHNVVLLIMNAMMLASFVLGLLIYPFVFSFDGFDESAIVDIPTNAGFVLFTLIIQDGILIWMVWHQVVRRRVIPLSEMGISRSILGDSTKMMRYTGQGIMAGLVLFGLALLIELGQSAAGFVPPDDAIVIGPETGNLGAYLLWLVSGCIIAPVSEEFFFRGYAFYAFNKRHGLLVALFVSAFGFSAIHGSIYALLPIFVAGIGLALAYHWSGSLVPPMVAHAVNNFLALTLMYIGFYG